MSSPQIQWDEPQSAAPKTSTPQVQWDDEAVPSYLQGAERVRQAVQIPQSWRDATGTFMSRMGTAAKAVGGALGQTYPAKLAQGIMQPMGHKTALEGMPENAIRDFALMGAGGIAETPEARAIPKPMETGPESLRGVPGGAKFAERSRPINVRGPGEIAPERPRGPRAFYGGVPPEPIPQRPGLALPSGEPPKPEIKTTGPTPEVKAPIRIPPGTEVKAKDFAIQRPQIPETPPRNIQVPESRPSDVPSAKPAGIARPGSRDVLRADKLEDQVIQDKMRAQAEGADTQVLEDHAREAESFKMPRIARRAEVRGNPDIPNYTPPLGLAERNPTLDAQLRRAEVQPEPPPKIAIPSVLKKGSNAVSGEILPPEPKHIGYEYRGGQFYKDGKVLDKSDDIADAVAALEPQKMIDGVTARAEVQPEAPTKPWKTPPSMQETKNIYEDYANAPTNSTTGRPVMINGVEIRKVEEIPTPNRMKLAPNQSIHAQVITGGKTPQILIKRGLNEGQFINAIQHEFTEHLQAGSKEVDFMQEYPHTYSKPYRLGPGETKTDFIPQAGRESQPIAPRKGLALPKPSIPTEPPQGGGLKISDSSAQETINRDLAPKIGKPNVEPTPANADLEELGKRSIEQIKARKSRIARPSTQ